jgi:hypothetical protein
MVEYINEGFFLEYPEDADKPHDGDPRGVEHEREEAKDDHEHVKDVPPALVHGSRGWARARVVAERGVWPYPFLIKGVNQLTKRFTQSSAVNKTVKARLSVSKVAAQVDSASVLPIWDSITLTKKFCEKSSRIINQNVTEMVLTKPLAVPHPEYQNGNNSLHDI